MALALNKIIVSGLNSDADGAYFDYVTQSVTAGTDYTLPAGLYVTLKSFRPLALSRHCS